MSTAGSEQTGDLIEFRAISKAFGPVTVLREVSFGVRPGEIHALLGENGAGKSTLMKVLGGYHAPSSGELWLGGQPVQFASSREAEARGIVLIHQEFNLADDLSAAQNIYLGHELGSAWFGGARFGGDLLDNAAMLRGARAALARLGVTLDPARRVRDLSVPQKQLVEIAKALAREARVLIMDKPTASLTLRESGALLELMRRLRAEGVTILYISHKLDEVSRVADRVTVLRDGRFVATEAAADLTPGQMASLMVGRDLEGVFPEHTEPSPEVRLEVEHLSVPGWSSDLSFCVWAGDDLRDRQRRHRFVGGLDGGVDRGLGDPDHERAGTSPGQRLGHHSGWDAVCADHRRTGRAVSRGAHHAGPHRAVHRHPGHAGHLPGGADLPLAGRPDFPRSKRRGPLQPGVLRLASGLAYSDSGVRGSGAEGWADSQPDPLWPLCPGHRQQ